MYKRVLLKLSGEALAADNFPFNVDTLAEVARQIKEVTNLGVKVGVVIGGGNICRGRIFETLGFDRVKADYAGMLATVINSIMLEQSLTNIGVKAKALTVIEAQNVEKYDIEKANHYLQDGYVLIFAGGYGQPYYSTDSGSAQRAAEINADIILMAKTGVDGVYNKDPNKYDDAIRYDKLTFNDILKQNLQVMDLQAAEICIKHNIDAFVFNMLDKDNIIKAAKGEAVGTKIDF